MQRNKKLSMLLFLLCFSLVASSLSSLTQTEFSNDNRKKLLLSSNKFDKLTRMFDEKLANDSPIFSQNYASTAVLSNTNLAIVWNSYSQDGNQRGVFGKIFNTITGDNITSEFQVNEHTANDQMLPSICAISIDTIAITWQSYGQDGDSYGIYARIFNASTGTPIISEFQVHQNVTGSQSNPIISALSADSFAILWQIGAGPGDFDIKARIFNATTGSPLTPEFQINQYKSGSQSLVSLSALSDYKFAAAWWGEGSDDSSGIYASVFNSTTGAQLTSEFRVNFNTTGVQIYPSISGLSNDSFVVSFQSPDVDYTGVFARIFNASNGNNITREFQVNTYTTERQFSPSVSTLTSDEFVITWQSNGQDGDSYGIYANIFNATGNPLTSEFKVNQYTANTQQNPSVSRISNDNFAIAWESFMQDGGGDGIYFTVFGLDTTAPNVWILNPQTDTYGSPSLLIDTLITDTSPINSAKLMINNTSSFSLTKTVGDSWSCTWDNVSDYASGDYNLSIRAVDLYGNVNNTVYVVITLETSIPSVSIISPTPGINGLQSILINASITDLESNITEAKAMINATVPFNITMSNLAGNSWTCLWDSLAGQSNGYYEIVIWARDQYGNVNHTQSVVIFLDVNGPQIIFNSLIPNEFYGFSAPDYDLSIPDSDLNMVWYTLDNGVLNITLSGLAGVINQAEWDKLGNGTVIISFYSNDTLGNVNLAVLKIYKDTIDPISVISFDYYQGENTVSKSSAFTIVSDDENGSGIFLSRYKINNSDWIDYTVPFDLSSYDYGYYNITYQAVDNVANRESPKSVIMKVVPAKGGGSIPGYNLFVLIGIISITPWLRKLHKDFKSK